MSYVAPAVTDLGTIREVTLQQVNKIGPTPDGLAPAPIVGSVVPVP